MIGNLDNDHLWRPRRDRAARTKRSPTIRNLDNETVTIRGLQVRAAQSAMENGRASLAADLERHQREREAMSKEKAAGHAAIAQREARA